MLDWSFEPEDDVTSDGTDVVKTDWLVWLEVECEVECVVEVAEVVVNAELVVVVAVVAVAVV